MTISDEIRKWCDEADVDGNACWVLRELARRIDDGMVELPRDRDGKVIHIGDTVWDVWDGMEFTVTSITLYADSVAKVDASCYGCDAHTSPTCFTHKRPDSLERIADELDGWRLAASLDCRIKAIDEDIVYDLAERIRKLAKEGEHATD